MDDYEYDQHRARERMLESALPHSAEAERAILGSILLDNSLIDEAVSLLSPDDFYAKAHQFVFRSMINLTGVGMEIDPLLLSEDLRREGFLEQAGGMTFISEITYGLPHFTNVAAYAKVVKDHSVMRQLVKVANKITNEALEGEDDADTVLDNAGRMVFQLAETRARREIMAAGSLVDGTLQRTEDMQRTGNPMSGVSTGLNELDAFTLGLQKTDLIIVAARPSMGKAQPLDAKVLMRDGRWIPMGGLKVGDAVASPDGSPSRVVGIYPQGNRLVYRLTFSDGRSTEADGEHIWRVSRHGELQPREVTTEQLREMLERSRWKGRVWIEPPCCDVDNGEPLPVPPWALGVLIGDGCLSGGGTPTFTTVDDEIAEGMRRELGPTFELTKEGYIGYRVTQAGGRWQKGVSGTRPNPLKVALDELGLWGKLSAQKFIPDAYMTSSRDNRLALLQGLMDTDGCAEKFACVYFSTISERLACQVRDLARSLGCVAKVRPPKQGSYRTPEGEEREGQLSYEVHIAHAAAPHLFRLPRKAQRARRTRAPRLTITSIEATRMTPVQCIKVSHPLGLYVTDEYITTHNTSLGLTIAQHVGLMEPGAVAAFFSLEMGKDQIMLRMLSSEAKVDGMRLRSGYVGQEEWARLREAGARIKAGRLFIDDTPGISPLQLLSASRRLASRQGRLDLVVVDYLGLMSQVGRKQSESRQQEVSAISRDLKGIAKELNVPLVALAQLNRSPEQRSDHRPQLSDLRESGSIEQDADVVAFIFREEQYNRTEENAGTAEIIIAKNRSGPTGTVKAAYLKEFTRFENMWRD